MTNTITYKERQFSTKLKYNYLNNQSRVKGNSRLHSGRKKSLGLGHNLDTILGTGQKLRSSTDLT